MPEEVDEVRVGCRVHDDEASVYINGPRFGVELLRIRVATEASLQTSV